MNIKLIGGILLIIGTSIGGGMLALPAATASEGFMVSSLLLLACWMAMTIGAFLILEVNLWLNEESNIISMAKMTLGRSGEIIAWLSYLLLLYALLSAYISGGTDILQSIFAAFHLNLPDWLASVLFVIIFGSIVYHGIKIVDFTNRGLMSAKIIVYLALVATVIPHVQVKAWHIPHPVFYITTITVAITSFGFATIIPSLRTYFNSDVKKLRFIVFMGSLIALVVYIIWDGVVQGSIPRDGSLGLLQMQDSGHAATELFQALSAQLHNEWVTSLSHVFVYICILTSFLGVSLCLVDFLADGLKLKKQGKNKVLVNLATFIPPLAIILFYPGAFITALSYAGIFCVILLMLLPALMAWSGRYYKQVANVNSYQVFGGKALLVLEIILSIVVLVASFYH